jgi:hypothetical protein
MPLFKLYPTLAIISLLAIVSVFIAWPKQNSPATRDVGNNDVSLPPPYTTQASAPQISPISNPPSISPGSSSLAIAPAAFVESVEGFVQRVTKKPFGLYVDPDNSPVQPEMFTGYHTGADAEYDDTAVGVSVNPHTLA